MHQHMPPSNPRKRPAPGASPVLQTPQAPQTYSTPSQLSNDDFLRWTQSPDNTTYPDPATYNMNTYGGNTMSQGPYTQAVPAPSTQLARRPLNRQLVTAQRPGYDTTGDPWGQFGDDSILDPQGANGMMEENDNIDLLEERAAVAKRDAQSKRKQIPPFVQKLSSFLDESKNTELIRWSDRGDSFVVLDEDEFAKTLIPELFKHNNYASFVRQLNMYGFHKRVGLSDNSMKASERKNKSPSEYYNPYFKRGHPNLLWLINKPKGGGKATAKARGRVKNEDVEMDSGDEDGKEGVEEIYGHGYGSNNMPGQPRAISAAPESGQLQKRDLALVQSQLAEFQKQQSVITNAISRLRKDHNALYQQSMAFQTLHDRHESSINAILTFLATIYNRSLDGQGNLPQNLQQMAQTFAAQQEQGPHGNIVDMGDVNNQEPTTPGSPSPRRQRLLMAPPIAGGRATTLSPAASGPGSKFGSHPYVAQNTARPGAIEELFDTPPTDNPQVKLDPEPLPRQEMMDIINNTNAQATQPGNKMDFPEMLSHYENANGNSPLTPEQRNNMLNIIASTASAPGSNNALVTPAPPQPPSLTDFGYTQAEIDGLMRLQQEQDTRLQNVSTILQPLSPSGSIPGLENGQYFNGDTSLDPHGSNLDLDQFLDSGAYYNGGSPAPDFSYDSFNDNAQLDSNFNFGTDGAADDVGRIVETIGSDAATPENTEDTTGKDRKSPNKKRRKT